MSLFGQDELDDNIGTSSKMTKRTQ